MTNQLNNIPNQVTFLIENNGAFITDNFTIVGVFINNKPSEEQLFDLIKEYYVDRRKQPSAHEADFLKQNIKHILEDKLTFFWYGDSQFFLEQHEATAGTGKPFEEKSCA